MQIGGSRAGPPPRRAPPIPKKQAGPSPAPHFPSRFDTASRRSLSRFAGKTFQPLAPGPAHPYVECWSEF